MYNGLKSNHKNLWPQAELALIYSESHKHVVHMCKKNNNMQLSERLHHLNPYRTNVENRVSS